MESFLEDIFMVENILNFKLKSMIIYFHFPGLFSKIFPTGNAESFCNHIFRLFDSDGNNFLDFKEFLMALDIAQCTDERQKLEWSFRYLDNMYDIYSISIIYSQSSTLEKCTYLMIALCIPLECGTWMTAAVLT